MTASSLPRHVGIIMDGNGRWAQLRNRPRIEGHRAGAESVRDITRAARQLGIEALTLYAFSSQNWARPADEVAGLMQLLRDFLIDERAEILDNGIRLEALGDIERLPPLVREPLDELRAASAANSEMVLTLALSYGGRESIARAARAAATTSPRAMLRADDLDADRLGSYLPTAQLPAARPAHPHQRASSASRTSCCGRSPTPSSCSSTCCGPSSAASTSTSASKQYAARERRFGTDLRSSLPIRLTCS